MSSIKRCELCNIPSNYPGVFFDECNVCSLCKRYQKVSDYKGIEALKEDIQKFLLKYPERKYDCAIGFSGGKDSSYLLYFAKEILKLNVLAVTLDNDFVPLETKENIINIPKLLSVDSVIITNKLLNYCSRKSVHAWAKKPTPQMLLTFCSGCRYGIKKLLPNYIKNQHIPILLVGDMHEEEFSYRTDILALNPDKPTSLFKILGYFKQLIKNTYYLLSPKCILMSLKEFILYHKNNHDQKSNFLKIIKPFYDYVEVKDELVIDILKQLGWKYNNSFNASKRSDCYLNIIRQHYYRKMLGYNDLDVKCMDLIHRKKITKQDGLQQIQEDNYSEEFLNGLMKKYFNLSIYDIDSRINKSKPRDSI